MRVWAWVVAVLCSASIVFVAVHEYGARSEDDWLVVFSAWSRREGPPPDQASEHHEQKSAAEDHSADGEPKKVDLAKPVGQRLAIIWERTWDDPVAFYTFVLSIFTLLLAIISALQMRFLIRADRTARIAADAAKRSADAARDAADAAKKSAEIIPVTERPFVFVLSTGSDFRPSFFVGAKPTIELVFHNYGRTPANLHHLFIGFRALDHLPSEADTAVYVGDSDSKFEMEVIIGADASWNAPRTPCHEKFDQDTALAVTAGRLNFYFWGSFVYRDIFGRNHATYFCRQYDVSRREWFPVGGMERNRGE